MIRYWNKLILLFLGGNDICPMKGEKNFNIKAVNFVKRVGIRTRSSKP
jgi:lysophospholipase L1-like esterase